MAGWVGCSSSRRTCRMRGWAALPTTVAISACWRTLGAGAVATAASLAHTAWLKDRASSRALAACLVCMRLSIIVCASFQQRAGHARRGHLVAEGSPVLGARTALAFDIGFRHVLAQVVIDDISAHGIVELQALRRFLGRIQAHVDQPFQRFFARAAAFEVLARDVVVGVA